MAAESKDAPPEQSEAEQEAALARKWQTTRVQMAGFAMNIFAWLCMIPARPEMVLKVSGGDPGLASQTLASMTGATSLVEFLMAGLLGRLSDKVGRRPILMTMPVVAACGRMMTLAASLKDGGNNRAWVVGANWLDRMISGSAFPVYMHVHGAAMADMWMKHKDQTILPALGAKTAGYAGLAIAAAPFCGAQVMARTGSVAGVPLLSGGVSLLHSLFIYSSFRETLPAEQRREFKWSGASPLAFTQFFTSPGKDGKRMRVLGLALLLGALTRDMHDTRMVLLKTKLGFGAKEVGNYMLASGSTVMLQGYASASTMKNFGLVKHTYLATLMAIGEQLAWSVTSSAKGIVLACIFGILGNTYAAGINHMLARTGERALGIGRGQLNAMFANMHTIVKIPGPLLFATLFGKFGQAAPFRLAATLLTLSGLIFTLLPDEDEAAAPKKEDADAKQK